jgi:hypothetical protein
MQRISTRVKLFISVIVIAVVATTFVHVGAQMQGSKTKRCVLTADQVTQSIPHDSELTIEEAMCAGK